MAIKKISISQFLEQAAEQPVIDVRSDGEFKHAHIPGAYSLPLFNDEERKIVGTAYKQKGKQQAIKLGLDFFGVKMKGMIEEAEKISNNYKPTGITTASRNNTVVVHCWRGGMRSAGVAWLLDLYGFDVYTIIGGYKAYRNWVLQQFEKEYQLTILGGYTGSGKTDVLKSLQNNNKPVIDLEGLANHRGSAFGSLGEQPSQEMFENLLAQELNLQQKHGNPIWIEDESQRIGQINIPHQFWKQMRSMSIQFLDIPFENRLDYLLKSYGKINKEALVNAIIRIQKRLGPLETKTAIGFLVEENYKACFEILLTYYDKMYTKGLHNRENLTHLLNKIPCTFVDAISNTEKLISCETLNT